MRPKILPAWNAALFMEQFFIGLQQRSLLCAKWTSFPLRLLVLSLAQQCTIVHTTEAEFMNVQFR